MREFVEIIIIAYALSDSRKAKTNKQKEVNEDIAEVVVVVVVGIVFDNEEKTKHCYRVQKKQKLVKKRRRIEKERKNKNQQQYNQRIEKSVKLHFSICVWILFFSLESIRISTDYGRIWKRIFVSMFL